MFQKSSFSPHVEETNKYKYKVYTFRLYPDEDQKILIGKTFGCARFVYNQCLLKRKDLYKETGKDMTYIDCNNYCNQILKKQYEWLKEVDKWALSNSIAVLNNNYKSFFEGKSQYPRFHSKKSHRFIYTTTFNNNNITVDIEQQTVKVPKIGLIKGSIHRKIQGEIKQASIVLECTGKYFIHIKTKEKLPPPMEGGSQIGIDLGIKNLMIYSNGTIIKNPKRYFQLEKLIKRRQRQLSSKQRTSKNYEKARIKLAKIWERYRNLMRDYIHKVTTSLIKDNQLICLEDLDIKEMMSQNKFLRKQIFYSSWGLIYDQIKIKSYWYGRKLIFVNKYFPSSQKCYYCGYKNKDIKNLKIRQWICPNCRKELDRDLNAALNILTQGLKQNIKNI